MYVGFDSVASGAIKTIADLTAAERVNATHAELQAVTNNISYTMDNVTVPTATAGMQLLTTDPPKSFLIEDILRIKFIQGVGGAGVLNVHYFGGRDI